MRWIFSPKKASVKPLKDKEAKTVYHGFIEIVTEFKRKPNELWVDQGRDIYNNPMEKWLGDSGILMYSIHNDRKSVDAERFIKTLKVKYIKNDS